MGRRSEGWTIRKAKGSPYYSARFTTPEGRRIERSTACKRKAEASKEAARIYAEAVSGGGRQGEVGPEAVSLIEIIPEWAVHLEVLGKSESWVDTCETYAAAHWIPRWPTLDMINDKSVQAYIATRLRAKNKRGKPISHLTVRKELSALNTFLRWCAQQGHWSGPLPRWESPVGQSDYQPVCLTREQVETILEHLPHRDQGHGLPAWEWYTVMWATSFRKGTMARLKWSDIDLEAGVINVRASTDKKRNARAVPLTPAALEVLDDMGPGVGLVFGEIDFRGTLRAAAKAAGLPPELVKRLTANHSIRHARLTDLASRSKNLAAVMHMAGHRDLASTQRYVHGSLEGARDLLAEVGDGVAGE